MIRIKKLVKGILFCLCFCVLFMTVQAVLQPKWIVSKPGNFGITTAVDEFKSLEKNTVDVFFVGSSHTYCGVDPLYLYDTTGITSYCVSGPGMQMDTAYLALNEFLKTQSPSVVFLDMSAIHYKAGVEAKTHKVLDQLNISVEKIRYGFETWNEDMTALEAVFPLFRYHSRWDSLQRKDIAYLYGETPKSFSRGHSITYKQEDSSFHFDYEHKPFTIAEYNLTYLDRMVELCKKNGAELVLMKIPTRDWYRCHSEFSQQYADENGLEFLEMYYAVEEMGIDVLADFRDSHDHLNQSGAEKVTAYLGNYIQEHFNLKDQRNSNARWDKDLESYREHKQNKLEEALQGIISDEDLEAE